MNTIQDLRGVIMDKDEGEKEFKRIIYDNRSDELPLLQLTTSEEVEGLVIKSTQLICKARKYKDLEKGINFLINKNKELSLKKNTSKYKDRSIG
jgi:hypothetical protein